MSEPNQIPPKSRSERFVIGFLYGAFSGILAVLLSGSPFEEAFLFVLFSGSITGGIAAICNQRGFQFLIDFITTFPG